jgi:hypothetical protein
MMIMTMMMMMILDSRGPVAELLEPLADLLVAQDIEGREADPRLPKQRHHLAREPASRLAAMGPRGVMMMMMMMMMVGVMMMLMMMVVVVVVVVMVVVAFHEPM